MKFRPVLFGISWLMLRLLLSAWVGAAVLFVVTSVAEQTASEFDSVTRDQLATIRFPLYYAFGLSIYLGSAVALTGGWLSAAGTAKRRILWLAALIAASAAVFAYDYFQVYSPLQQLIIPPGAARGQDFVRLHRASEYANTIHVFLMLAAAGLACWPCCPTPSAPRTGTV